MEDTSGNTMFVKLVTFDDNPTLTSIAQQITTTLEKYNIDYQLITIPQFKFLDYVKGIDPFDIAIIPVKFQPGLYTTTKFLMLDSGNFTGNVDNQLPYHDNSRFLDKPLLWSAIQKMAIKSFYSDIYQLTPALFETEEWFVNPAVHNFHNKAAIGKGFSLQTLEYIFVE